MPTKRSPKKSAGLEPIRTSRVLIIEDDEPTRDALVLKLADMHIAAETARDGEEAGEKIHARAWDVIVVDLLLPKKDGFSLLEEIRREPHCAHATVFVFTNLSGAEHRERALALGAHEFIEKTKVSLARIAEKIAVALTPPSL